MNNQTLDMIYECIQAKFEDAGIEDIRIDEHHQDSMSFFRATGRSFLGFRWVVQETLDTEFIAPENIIPFLEKKIDAQIKALKAAEQEILAEGIDPHEMDWSLNASDYMKETLKLLLPAKGYK